MNVIVYENTARVTLSKDKFQEDLDWIKDTIAPEDRSYSNGIWVIRNLEKYARLPRIAAAIENRKVQAVLPGIG